jgi:hypothetical protein
MATWLVVTRITQLVGDATNADITTPELAIAAAEANITIGSNDSDIASESGPQGPTMASWVASGQQWKNQSGDAQSSNPHAVKSGLRGE